MLRSSNKGFLKNIITNRHPAADIGVSNLLSQEKEEDRLQNGPLQSIETPDYPRNDSRIPAATAEPTTPATLASTSILPYFFITVSTTLRQSSAEETSAFRKVTSPSFSFLMLFFRFFLAF